MRFIIIIITALTFLGSKAQSSYNMSLAYQWKDTTLVPSTIHDNTYNEIWGYEQGGREYAIIGSTDGTHIFDVTDANNVDTAYFIPGRVQGAQIIHRDYDTYRNYLYIVSDEGASSLQIADLSFLPDSAPVVYDDNALIERSHNIFIDTAAGNLYTCGGATNLGVNFLSVYSLSADPINPQFVTNCNNDVPFWTASVGYVHDIYVKNDTAYCNAGPNGLFVIDFSNMANVQSIGSITSYPHQGYNHSGWLHSSGDYYALADEDHGHDVKILDVTNFSNITLIDTISTNIDPNSIPHNLIFKGDRLFVSYYFDGIYVFDTSDPYNISLSAYYDTSLRPHLAGKFQGNWGVYPFLSSGKILASDMQEGLFVFDPLFPIGINERKEDNFAFVVYPNPTKESITVTTTLFDDALDYSIMDLNGKVVKSGNLLKAQTKISLDAISSGFYVFGITKNDGSRIVKKFIKE